MSAKGVPIPAGDIGPIERGVPIPKPGAGARGASKYPFAQMKVGGGSLWRRRWKPAFEQWRRYMAHAIRLCGLWFASMVLVCVCGGSSELAGCGSLVRC